MNKPATAGKSRYRNRNTNVVHTWSELATIGRAAPQLLEPTNDSKRVLELFLRGQMALPEDRRRPAKSVEIAVRYKPAWMQTTLRKMSEALAKTPEELAALEPSAKVKSRRKTGPTPAAHRPVPVAAAEAPPARKPHNPNGMKPGTKITRWNRMQERFIAFDEEVFPLISRPDYNPPNAKLVDKVMRAQTRQLNSDERRPRKSVAHAPGRMLRVLRAALERGRPAGIVPLLPDPPAVPQEAANEPASAPMVAPSVPGVADALANAFAALGAVLMPAIRAMVVDVAREVAREVVAQHKPMEVTVHVPPPPAPPSASDISAAVRATVYDVLGGTEQKNGEPTAPLSETPAAAPAAKRPRVDVVGLTGKNAEVVRQRCGDMFDLRFLDPDEARSRDVSAPQTIVCRKFVPHAAVYRMTANTDTDIVFVEGAGHSVVKKLHSMVPAMRQ